MERLLTAGVSRVVVGSLAVTKPDAVAEWLDRFGPNRITLAFDVRVGEDGAPTPALKGWTEAAGFDLWTALDRYPADALLIPAASPVLAKVARSADWHEAYRDPSYVVLRRRS